MRNNAGRTHGAFVRRELGVEALARRARGSPGRAEGVTLLLLACPAAHLLAFERVDHRVVRQ